MVFSIFIVKGYTGPPDKLFKGDMKIHEHLKYLQSRERHRTEDTTHTRKIEAENKKRTK